MNRACFLLRFRRVAAFFLLAAALGLIPLPGPVARADIVPPEKLHPAAEAYRRAAFVLNLNPIPWEQVWRDTEQLAGAIARVDPKEAARFRREIAAARKVALPRARDGEKPDPVAARILGSRRVFAAATRAVGRLLLVRIEAALASRDREVVAKGLAEARQVSRAFEKVLPYLDPQGWRGIQLGWLEAFSHLGTAGVMGAGARPMNPAGIRAALAPIQGYFTENFHAFAPGPERRLLARPKASPTYDETARVPWRLPPGANINKQLPRPRQILGMAERGVDESETFLIALGDMAFDSPFLFGAPTRGFGISCNVCHNKGVTNPAFFIPGLSARKGGVDVSNSLLAGHANNGLFDPVDTPDLRGIRFTAPYGRNGRFASLREFVRNGIVNEFNGREPDPMILDGMIAYLNEFEFLPNPKLRRDGRLDPKRASAAALRGEKIFGRRFPQMMGGKSCAGCHVPSTHFLDQKRHDIGTVRGAGRYAIDGALDTPTLLSARFTAPYFHDGSQPTLRAVNEWFNRRFGLGLSKSEVGDLTAYVESVGDGVEAYEKTVYTLGAELEEFGFFLSTYERLREQGKRDLVVMLLRTVAFNVRADKWTVQDKSLLPVLNRMEGLMREALDLYLKGREKETDAKVAAYRALYRKNVDVLK